MVEGVLLEFQNQVDDSLLYHLLIISEIFPKSLTIWFLFNSYEVLWTI